MRDAAIVVAVLVVAIAAEIAMPDPAASQATGVAIVRVDTWEAVPDGPLDLSHEWQLNPRAPSKTFRYPPAIVVDGAQRALRLKTDHETMSIWRLVQADLRRTPRLTWEWKALALSAGADVRKSGRNDQAARVTVLFEGWKLISYVWDTQAPVGTEVRPDQFGMVERVLVVIRSGSAGLGQWQREERDVRADYRRLFEEDPPAVKLVSVESHSDDVEGQSEALFGRICFER
jgi:hypothetical protein